MELRAVPTSSLIRYGFGGDAWNRFANLVAQIIEDEGIVRICEVGGGANPLLASDYVIRNGLDYVVCDVSEAELSKASSGYTKLALDITASTHSMQGRFDLVITKMVAEHVRDAVALHRNILAMLRPGGMAIHFFPTLYSLPFVMNRLLPSSVSHGILSAFAPREESHQGKFPAYYRWCRGPTPKALRRLRSLGFEVIEYVGFFGHDYYRRIPVLRTVQRRVTSFLLNHPNPHLTSYAHVVLRKPGRSLDLKGKGEGFPPP